MSIILPGLDTLPKLQKVSKESSEKVIIASHLLKKEVKKR
jgi:hypothetical protein